MPAQCGDEDAGSSKLAKIPVLGLTDAARLNAHLGCQRNADHGDRQLVEAGGDEDAGGGQYRTAHAAGAEPVGRQLDRQVVRLRLRRAAQLQG